MNHNILYYNWEYISNLMTFYNIMLIIDVKWYKILHIFFYKQCNIILIPFIYLFIYFNF
jgi:hypothetical protein